MAQDKIKRSLLWIRKSLEIIEKTTLPGTINDQIRLTIDAFGWERYVEMETRAFSGVNVASISDTQVPEGFMRYIASAGLETSNNVLALHFWFENTIVRGGAQTAGLSRPFEMAIGTAGMRFGLDRPVLLAPGDQFTGRSVPATGVGETLILRMRAIDLPIGEYFKSL